MIIVDAHFRMTMRGRLTLLLVLILTLSSVAFTEVNSNSLGESYTAWSGSSPDQFEPNEASSSAASIQQPSTGNGTQLFQNLSIHHKGNGALVPGDNDWFHISISQYSIMAWPTLFIHPSICTGLYLSSTQKTSYKFGNLIFESLYK